MFLRILFRKMGLKENKYYMAAVYGLIYAVLFFAVFVFSSLYLGRLDLLKAFLFSLGIAFAMAITYLIKWEVFRFMKK